VTFFGKVEADLFQHSRELVVVDLAAPVCIQKPEEGLEFLLGLGREVEARLDFSLLRCAVVLRRARI